MGRKDEVRRVQELRRSSAASPVPSGKQYKRRPKHLGSKVQWSKDEGERTQT